jgi:hypothetical protein
LKYYDRLADTVFSRFSRCFYASLSYGATHRNLPNRNNRTAHFCNPKRQRVCLSQPRDPFFAPRPAQSISRKTLCAILEEMLREFSELLA